MGGFCKYYFDYFAKQSRESWALFRLKLTSVKLGA